MSTPRGPRYASVVTRVIAPDPRSPEGRGDAHVTTDLLPLSTLSAALSSRPCARQWGRVVAEWPEGIPLEVASVDRARDLGLALAWLAAQLPEQLRAEYDRATELARAEHDSAQASAWAEYDRAIEPARAEYDRVMAQASAMAEYDRATEPARAEYERAAQAEYERAVAYDRAMAPVRAEYDRVTALAWAGYDRAMALARAEYGRAKAQALVVAMQGVRRG